MSLDRTGANIKGVHNTPGIRRPNTSKPESISRVVGPKHHYGTRTQSKLQTESNDPDASALRPSSPDGPFSRSAHGILGQSPGFAQPALTETPVKKPKEGTGNDDEITQRNNGFDTSGLGTNDQSSTFNLPATPSTLQGRLTRSATKRIAENEGNDDLESMPDVQRSLKRRRAARQDGRDTQLPSPPSRPTTPGPAEDGVQPPVFNDPSSPYLTPATPGRPAEYSDEPPVYQSPSSPNIRPEAFEQVEGGYAYEDYAFVGEGGQEHMKFILEVSVPVPSNLGRRPRGS